MAQKIRRIVTGHQTDGTAIFISDDHFEPLVISTGDAAMATLWTSKTLPADCNDKTDGSLCDVGTTLKGGSVLRVVDMLPGASSPFHRSSSIDYGIVISGVIELVLDNGVSKSIGPGEIIVQRGTIHLWRNPSEGASCRIVFILTEAIPFQVNGNPLLDFMEH